MDMSLSKLRELVMNREACDSRGSKESDTTEQLNWTELNWGPSSVKEWRTKLKQHNAIYSFKMLYIHVACLLQLMNWYWYIISNLSP